MTSLARDSLYTVFQGSVRPYFPNLCTVGRYRAMAEEYDLAITLRTPGLRPIAIRESVDSVHRQSQQLAAISSSTRRYLRRCPAIPYR